MKTFGVIGSFLLLQLAAIGSAAETATADPAEVAKQILASSGVHGGLVVHVNCGDGKLTAALHASDAYLVHGLARTTQELEDARENICKQQLYGPVSVDLLASDTLPYIDNSVNFVVLGAQSPVGKNEVLRVLRPGGVCVTLDSRLSTLRSTGPPTGTTPPAAVRPRRRSTCRRPSSGRWSCRAD